MECSNDRIVAKLAQILLRSNEMNTVQTDLVITGAHLPTAAVFWKGQQVPNISNLKVINGVVTLTIPEDPLHAEMQAAGIKIVRSAP